MIQPSLFDKVVRPHFEATRADWLAEARMAARRLGRKGDIITIDDVRAVCPPPEGVDPRVMGAVFQRSEWECVGYARSSRTECHKRPVGQFRLKVS